MKSFSRVVLLIVICAVELCAVEVVSAQVVQLPTFRFFGSSGTVLVPDRGSVSMGGNTSSYSGSSSRGLPGTFGPLGNNRGIAAGGSTGGVSVSAWIHDAEEMDTAILGMPVDEFQRQVRTSPAPTALPTLARTAPNPLRGPTPAERQRSDEAERAIKAARVQEHWDLARDAEERGKTTLAKMYYRIALRDAGGWFFAAEIQSAQARLDASPSPVAASPGAVKAR